ncbi:YpiB family protein [Vagococcus vulneris]|nr:YpiB family protein [Vagococcus vulneris]
MVQVENKKKFVNWLVQSVPLKQREAYWILNYILNHEIILTKTNFVKQADITPRGLVISDNHSTRQGIVLYKDQKTFTDPEQIFHEIRMNWRQTLYMEIDFVDSESLMLYQSIIEDNPYSIEILDATKFYDRFEREFDQENNQFRKKFLEHKINQSLEYNDHDQFIKFSKEYNDLMETIGK